MNWFILTTQMVQNPYISSIIILKLFLNYYTKKDIISAGTVYFTTLKASL